MTRNKKRTGIHSSRPTLGEQYEQHSTLEEKSNAQSPSHAFPGSFHPDQRHEKQRTRSKREANLREEGAASTCPSAAAFISNDNSLLPNALSHSSHQEHQEKPYKSTRGGFEEGAASTCSSLSASNTDNPPLPISAGPLLPEKTAEPIVFNKLAVTTALALDCEYVGVGVDGLEDQLARVSIVNSALICIYDAYVLPTEPVVDYRTCVSGVRPSHLENGLQFDVVQLHVMEILKRRHLVGHGIHNDLRVLDLIHPPQLIRDTARYLPLRKALTDHDAKKAPKLQQLADKLLNLQIQDGEHDSVVDAKAAMMLYQLHKDQWEKDAYRAIQKGRGGDGKGNKRKKKKEKSKK